MDTALADNVIKALCRQEEVTDVVTADPGVFEARVDAMCVVPHDGDHSTSQTAPSPQGALASAEPTRAEGARVIVPELRVHHDENAVEARRAGLTHALNWTADGELTSVEISIQDTQASSIELQAADAPEEQAAPASSYVPSQAQFTAGDEINAASVESSEVADSLISDIIEALGANQHEGIDIATLTSPGAMPAELESIWSEDTSEIAPNARKLRNALSTPNMV